MRMLTRVLIINEFVPISAFVCGYLPLTSSAPLDPHTAHTPKLSKKVDQADTSSTAYEYGYYGGTDETVPVDKLFGVRLDEAGFNTDNPDTKWQHAAVAGECTINLICSATYS